VNLRCGGAVDNIQLQYGDVWGNKHGGTGGNPLNWTVPTEEKITQITLSYGDGINFIQFITDQGSMSDMCGSPGDNEITIDAPDGYHLANIAGLAGQRVDQLMFYWGVEIPDYYEVQEIHYEIDGITPTSNGEISITKCTATNCGDIEESLTCSYSASYSISRSWQIDHAVEEKITFTVSGSIGIPLVAEGSVSLAIEAGYTYTNSHGEVDTITKSYDNNLEVTAQPHTKVIGEAIGMRFTADVPFEATLIPVFDNITRKDLAIKKKGVYHGTDVLDINAIWLKYVLNNTDCHLNPGK